MLEVTILKVKHSGYEEAKKLEHYIEQCDVFSPEAAFYTEEIASIEEKCWLELLKLSGSRVNKLLSKSPKQLYDPVNNEAIPIDFMHYRNKLYNLLHKYRKPIYCLERFSEGEIKNIKGDYSKEYSEGVKLLYTGRVNRALDIFRINFFRCFNEQVNLRDLHIAKNIDDAEEGIREKFKDISAKSTIRLVTNIGLCHEPEKYVIRYSPKIVCLYDDVGELTKKELQLLDLARNKEEISDLELLRKALIVSIERGLFKELNRSEIIDDGRMMTFDKINKLEYNDLCEIIKQIASKFVVK